MDHKYHYEYGDIVLSPLEERDIESLRILRNREKQFFFSPKDIEPEDQKKWYENYLMSGNDIMFKVSHRLIEDDFIGAIGVYDIDAERKVAEVGRTVIDKEKCKYGGVGLQATVGICLFSFTVLGVCKIVASILKTNPRILKVDTRAGFYISGEDEERYFIEMTRDSINIFR